MLYERSDIDFITFTVCKIKPTPCKNVSLRGISCKDYDDQLFRHI